MSTKWEILQYRLAELCKQVATAENELVGLERTRCGLTCSGCGTYLEFESDFAKHFEIPDTRYLNLGNCPIADKDKNNG